MLEFILGLSIGVAGLWFAAHEKFRHDVFREKINVYKRLQNIAAESLTCIIPSEKSEELQDHFKETTSELFIVLHQNAMFVEENVFSYGYGIWLSNFEDSVKEKKEFYDKFDNFINSMREDLKIKSLHNISSFLVRAPKVNKKIIDEVFKVATTITKIT